MAYFLSKRRGAAAALACLLLAAAAVGSARSPVQGRVLHLQVPLGETVSSAQAARSAFGGTVYAPTPLPPGEIFVAGQVLGARGGKHRSPRVLTLVWGHGVAPPAMHGRINPVFIVAEDLALQETSAPSGVALPRRAGALSLRGVRYALGAAHVIGREWPAVLWRVGHYHFVLAAPGAKWQALLRIAQDTRPVPHGFCARCMARDLWAQKKIARLAPGGASRLRKS